MKSSLATAGAVTQFFVVYTDALTTSVPHSRHGVNHAFNHHVGNAGGGVRSNTALSSLSAIAAAAFDTTAPVEETTTPAYADNNYYGGNNNMVNYNDWEAASNNNNIINYDDWEAAPNDEDDAGLAATNYNSRVITGRERRASWESYAPITSYGASPARHVGATVGGVIGSPGGVGDWYYTSSYGPATTTTAGTSSFAATTSSANSNFANQVAGSNNRKTAAVADNNLTRQQQQQQQSRKSVMTGRERRASFSSFDPFAPAHEATRRSNNRQEEQEVVGSSNSDDFGSSLDSNIGGTATSSRQYNDAETVASTLSSLSSSSDNASAPNNNNDLATPDFSLAAAVAESHGGVEDLLDFTIYDDTSTVPIQDMTPVVPDEQEEMMVTTTTEVPMDTPARQSLPPYLSLQAIPGKGLGVITNKPYSIGEFIGNYEGEIMSEEVKDRRYLSSLQDKLTQEDREWIQSRLERGQTLTGCYLYGVDLSDGNAQSNYGRFGRNREEQEETPKNRIYVDAEDEYHSLWTRFINHASPPYNNINPKSVPESYDGLPRVWFMANRDIEAGEELCFDYGDDYWLEGDEVV